jgi:hypothetical protein
MEVIYSSEILTFHWTTWCNISEDRTLQINVIIIFSECILLC